MKLNEFERLSLAAHYRILDKIDPDQGWLTFVTILEGGYEFEYSRLSDMLYSPLTYDECLFVIHTLAVFDALQRPYVDAKEEIPGDLKFPGFDGNNETGLLGYFRFLLEDNRFRYIKCMFEDGDSHAPFADGYRRMIAEWKRLGKPHSLSGDHAKAVFDARNP